MRSSTILFVLGVAMVAVNGVTTALISDGTGKGTQGKHRLLRSNSGKHKTDEERLKLSARIYGTKAYKKRQVRNRESARKFQKALLNMADGNDIARLLKKRNTTLKGLFALLARNKAGLPKEAKNHITTVYNTRRGGVL
uniref:Secreted RxLR effector protein 51 n=1 Tax=Plasmopara viticola TaxID=143451 RepID=RLR51_PLAVT|nr:RecName: Full=Secreted RxLR effector protein 51; Flags: Precursor [Plasmopara viticola]